MKKVIQVSLLIATIFLIFCIPAYAAPCVVCGENHDMAALSGLERTAYDWGCVVYGGQLFDVSDNEEDITTFDVLQFDTTDKFSGLWSQGEFFYDRLAVIGKLLVFLYCLLEIMEKAMSDFSSPEFFVKCLIKLLVGFMLIDYGYQIIGFIMNLASTVFDKIGGQISNNPAAIENCIYYEVQGSGFFDALGTMAGLFFPYLILQLAKIMVSIICWVRVLDIMVRVMFAPIGMADIVSNGLSSSGYRYLKKLGASALQGAVILAIVKAYGLITSLIANSVGGYITMIILALVVVSLMLKSSSIANEVVG